MNKGLIAILGTAIFGGVLFFLLRPRNDSNVSDTGANTGSDNTNTSTIPDNTGDLGMNPNEIPPNTSVEDILAGIGDLLQNQGNSSDTEVVSDPETGITLVNGVEFACYPADEVEALGFERYRTNIKDREKSVIKDVVKEIGYKWSKDEQRVRAFFKGVNVRPSGASAMYFKQPLRDWLRTISSIHPRGIQVGALLCQGDFIL